VWAHQTAASAPAQDRGEDKPEYEH
jgi:hypothetical protein